VRGPAEIVVGARAWVAVDFAHGRRDTASVGWQVERPDWQAGEPGRWIVDGHVWGVTPSDPNRRPPPAHDLLKAGEQISFAVVEDYLRMLGERFDVVAIAYDPWRFARSAELLLDEGAPMVEFPQSNERTAPASEQLLDDITNRVLMHGGDPVLAQHIKNAATKNVGRGWRLDKTATRKAMDWSTTLMMMNVLAQAPQDKPQRSVYEDRDLEVI
jgi:phage terminase large subunit-like protein